MPMPMPVPAPRDESASRTRAARPARAWLDPALALGFLLLVPLLRLPYLTQIPYAWDSVLYVRSVFLFNATIHQPQPPGYLFYVSAARLLELIFDDANRSLVWLSALASGVAAGALYLLARLLYDRATALVAAGLLATSVTFWFYGEIAYPYTTLAACSTLLALIALALRRGLLPGLRGAILAALAYGLLLGFRQDLILFLAPLFVAGMWGRPWRHWLYGVVAGALGVLAWLIPSATLSEGLNAYLDATSRQGGIASSGSSVFVLGPRALWTNGHEMAVFLWRGLYFAVPPLAYLLLRWLVTPRRFSHFSRWWVLLWLAPPLAFYLMAHLGDYGYTFSALPGLILLAARGVVLGTRDGAALLAWLLRRRAIVPATLPAWWRIASRSLLPVALGAVLMLGNGYLFVRHHAQLSAAGLACFDATMQGRLDILRRDFPPDETVVFSSAYYQHVRYLLPDYQSWFWEPANGPDARWPVQPGTRFLVIFDEEVHPGANQPGFQHAVLPCNAKPFYFTAVEAGQVARFDGRVNEITIQPAATGDPSLAQIERVTTGVDTAQ